MHKPSSTVKITRRDRLMTFLSSAAGVMVVYFLIRFVFILNSVPSESMFPTLGVGDRLIGCRLSYLFGEPERGDIVVFPYPDDPTDERGFVRVLLGLPAQTLYVKRVVGLPGETVVIRDGLVYINGSDTPLDESYVVFPDGESYGPFEVPEGSFLLLGDNRPSSNDARQWTNTYVSEDDIIAKVIFRYWPLSDLGGVR